MSLFLAEAAHYTPKQLTQQAFLGRLPRGADLMFSLRAPTGTVSALASTGRGKKIQLKRRAE
jgi:hypothetical protein